MADGAPIDDGCYVLTLRDNRVVAGLVRVTPAGVGGAIAQLELQTYAEMGGQRPYVAILSVESVVSHVPCTAEEARALAAALNRRSHHGMTPPPIIPTARHQSRRSFGE